MIRLELLILNYINFIEFDYFKVVEYMESKPPSDNKPVHVINIDIQDNHEEATMGAFLICDLIAMVRFYFFFYSTNTC